MPNKDPEKTRELKHAWYVKNKERLLQQKRDKRAAQKKVKPPKPPKPAPTPDQTESESPRVQPTGLSTVSHQKRGLRASIEPGLLPPEPRTYCATTTGPTCQGSTDQRGSIPKVTSVGGRVCRPFTRNTAWIRPDRANPAKRGTPS